MSAPLPGSFRRDPPIELAHVDCPTLVCVGELGPMTPVAAAREIADALSEGSVRLEVVEGTGHFTWKDAPDRYWSLLTDFVTTAAAAKPVSAPM